MPASVGQRRNRLAMVAAWALAAPLGLLANVAQADKVTLRDGRTLEGRLVALPSMSVDLVKAMMAEGVDSPQIVMVDDNLRRTFVSQRQVQEVNTAVPPEPNEAFIFKQPVVEGGSQITAVGQIVELGQFDEFGRRILKMIGHDGQLSFIQGITTLTPQWAQIESLKMPGQAYIWDMRLATSSIPPAVLDAILTKQIDPAKLDQRLKVVRFYLQSERYGDAEKKLAALIAEFPERKDQYEPVMIRLRQSIARRILAEVNIRREAGQYQLAHSMLAQFPTESVAGETLQAVRQTLDQETELNERGAALLKQLAKDVEGLSDVNLRARLAPLMDEIKREAGPNTIDRFAPYWQLRDDTTLPPEDRVALAISSWLIGADDAIRNLPVALSLLESRGLIVAYLNEPNKIQREAYVEKLQAQEGGSPRLVSKIIDHMKPPIDPGPSLEGAPGMYRFEVETLPGLHKIDYLVQLPPEYDPLRRYPTIVTLHGGRLSKDQTIDPSEQQIEWWAGARVGDAPRAGQATRQGYIVIAPNWAEDHQRAYEYSAREHAAVLNSLRDACRRFSIDTDRVFLSGHSMGGDAAWDIALAHPDLWAGVVPISASAHKFVSLYWENAKLLPFYLVNGGFDGAKANDNNSDLDRYFKNGYRATFVQYQGRGHEHFSDEILRIFDWMSRYKRDFFPREFTVRTLRSWDNFFWWVELADLPARVLIEPSQWPPPRGTLALNTVANLNADGGINVRTGAGRTTLWLSPEVVDFNHPARISVNGKSLRVGTAGVEPNLTILLEDVRTRADRRHPFWAKVEMPSGKVNDQLGKP